MSAEQTPWDDEHTKRAHIYSRPDVKFGLTTDMPLNQLTISELTAKLAKREVSSREITHA